MSSVQGGASKIYIYVEIGLGVYGVLRGYFTLISRKEKLCKYADTTKKGQNGAFCVFHLKNYAENKQMCATKQQRNIILQMADVLTWLYILPTVWFGQKDGCRSKTIAIS